jgi:chaperonin cofactor prefoldin
MTPEIKAFLENFLTTEEKIARVIKQKEQLEKEAKDFDTALKILTGEIEEEMVEI